MSETTAIEWCDSTFNPWIGCTRVSPACDDCYAARSTPARTLGVKWGAGEPRSRTSPSNWKKPLQWNKVVFVECDHCGWRGDAREAHGQCSGTLRRARRRVFCASLADVFDNEVDPAWRADLFALIYDTPNLDWLLLTKRVGNVPRLMDELTEPGQPWRLPDNVWLGATVVNQEEADRDIPKLIGIRARVRFLSIEPMLGPISLDDDDRGWLKGWHVEVARSREGYPDPYQAQNDRIDWIIVGGESGHAARPMHPDWVKSLRDQCQQAGAPFLFKQWGEWAPAPLMAPAVYEDAEIRGRLVGDMLKVGKRAAGRMLDGRTWDDFPRDSA